MADNSASSVAKQLGCLLRSALSERAGTLAGIWEEKCRDPGLTNSFRVPETRILLPVPPSEWWDFHVTRATELTRSQGKHIRWGADSPGDGPGDSHPSRQFLTLAFKIP
jgi:hypothetical protein